MYSAMLTSLRKAGVAELHRDSCGWGTAFAAPARHYRQLEVAPLNAAARYSIDWVLPARQTPSLSTGPTVL